MTPSNTDGRALGDGPIPLADHDEIGRKVFSLPWEIQAAIVTITAHCTALTDECPTGTVADLAGCISQNCLELANALALPKAGEAIPKSALIATPEDIASAKTLIGPSPSASVPGEGVSYPPGFCSPGGQTSCLHLSERERCNDCPTLENVVVEAEAALSPNVVTVGAGSIPHSHSIRRMDALQRCEYRNCSYPACSCARTPRSEGK